MGKRPQEIKIQPQRKVKKVKKEHIVKQQPKVKIQEGVEHMQEEKNEVEVIPQKQAGSENKKPPKNARIILRNLVVDISEKHIRKLLAPYGPVHDVQIPLHPDRPIAKGFAFVQLQNKNICNKVIKDLNGTKYKGRSLVIDLAIGKEKYQSQKLTKNDNQQPQSEEDLKQEQSIKEEKEQSENDQIDEQQQEKQQQDEKEQKEHPEQNYQNEIFIRNLPLTTSQQTLHRHFKKYGKIIFTRIVKDKETQMSKGTAFIKFVDEEVAKKLIEYSRDLEQKKQNKKSVEIDLEVDGVIVKVFPAESRNTISEKLKSREEGNKKPKKKPMKKIKKIKDLIPTDPHNKRKLDLALLGHWQASETMNKQDYQTFKAHEQQKLQKLKNPNNSVSSTRIILKHLPKTLTGEEINEYCVEYLNKNNQQKNSLQYCKLMLDNERKKSTGYAFIEFRKHEQSKEFIQQLTQHPEKLAKGSNYIIQFAIQDSRKMLKFKKKIKKTPK